MGCLLGKPTKSEETLDQSLLNKEESSSTPTSEDNLINKSVEKENIDNTDQESVLTSNSTLLKEEGIERDEAIEQHKLKLEALALDERTRVSNNNENEETKTVAEIENIAAEVVNVFHTDESPVEATLEPVVEAASEPVVETAPEPVVEAAPELVVEAASEPVVEAAAEPTVKPSPESKPVIVSATENNAKISYAAVADPASPPKPVSLPKSAPKPKKEEESAEVVASYGDSGKGKNKGGAKGSKKGKKGRK